jgi:hypothetical protein
MEIINTNYKEFTDFVNALTELYKAANDKAVIDLFIKSLSSPQYYIREGK